MSETTVLLVEDDQELSASLDLALKRLHYKVTKAPNGLKAKELLSHWDFDLILSDVKMPEMDGIELLEWFRSKSIVPFIMMTAHAEVLETKSAYDLGANGFLQKT